MIDLPDINVWIALAWDGHEKHSKAKDWFESLPEGEQLAFCRVTQMGFLRLLTQAKVMDVEVHSQAQAWRVFDRILLDARMLFLSEAADCQSVWRTFTQSDSPKHQMWTDAFLAAFAIKHDLRLVSFDQGMSQFPGLNKLILA